MHCSKALIIPLLLTLILALIGITYAQWTETLTIEGTVYTAELDCEFYGTVSQSDPPGTNDWNNIDGTITQTDKDVGCTTTEFEDTDGDGDYDKLEINFTNVYPYYYNQIGFFVHNNGDIPLKITKVVFKVDDKVVAEITSVGSVSLDLNGDGKSDVTIYWGNNFNVEIDPCESLGLSFSITFLQDCPENYTVTLTIEIIATQYNA